MDEIKLTEMFVQYANLRKAAQALEEQIKAAVLEIGETRKIAGVTATYYKPSNETPDYEGAAKSAPGFENVNLNAFQTTTVTTRWKEVCEYLQIEPAPGAEKPPRVTIK